VLHVPSTDRHPKRIFVTVRVLVEGILHVTFLFGGVKHLNIFCASMQRYQIIVYSGDLIPFQMKMHPSFLHSTLFAYIEQRMCTIHFVTKYVPVYLYVYTHIHILNGKVQILVVCRLRNVFVRETLLLD
jgi:hypothetical protein